LHLLIEPAMGFLLPADPRHQSRDQQDDQLLGRRGRGPDRMAVSGRLPPGQDR
jgi:hypothetical protein